MSIILKPSALKVKDDNGNYIGTNMFAAESTQEYLDAITTIGTQTKTAIQNKSTQAQAAMEAKAEQTIESIPDDYTELAGDVTTLKADLSELPKIVKTEEDDADLYIADKDGYVIAEFSDGHIRTKNFDSSNVSENAPTIELTDSASSLDVTDGSGNVIARFQNGDFKTKNFDSSIRPVFCEYLFSNSELLLAFKYIDTSDAVAVFNVGRANDLFDFKSFRLKPADKPLNDCVASDFSTVWDTGTDMHSPFQFNAMQNADGYYSDATDAGYTGGNHTVTINNTEVKSASSRYVHYYADGEEVTSGYGVFINFEIKWANNVQAYNCVKADGTGRTSLIEYHDMIFDGVRFNEEVTIIPQEDIKFELWHGFQSVGWNGVYDHARFVDATNRNIFTPSDESITSGNSMTSGIIQWGSEHGLEMRVDLLCDLGKRTYYSGTSGAFLSNSIHKGYFYIIKNEPTGYELDANDAFFLRGSYRFFPVVA